MTCAAMRILGDYQPLLGERLQLRLRHLRAYAAEWRTV